METNKEIKVQWSLETGTKPPSKILMKGKRRKHCRTEKRHHTHIGAALVEKEVDYSMADKPREESLPSSE